MKRTVLILSALMLVGQTGGADDAKPKAASKSKTTLAQVDAPKTEAAKPPTDEDEVRAQLKSYVEAFNKHDAAALAAHWAENGVSIDEETGERTAGRKQLEQDFAEFFKEYPQARLSGRLTDIRLVRPDIALTEGEVTVMTADGAIVDSIYTAVLVKEKDRWLIANSEEQDAPVPATSYDALKELEWMVGTWQDDSDAANVTTNVRWTENGAFLLRSFSVTYDDGETFQGSQIIGWDPSQEQIRTWTFNSDGSFGEGAVSKNGEDWMIKMAHVGSDGSLTSSTQVITPVDENTMKVQTIGEVVDGAPVPASDPVTVIRIEEEQEEAAEAAEEESPEQGDKQ